MKYLTLIFSIILMASCTQESQNPQKENEPTMDVAAELEKIEQLRAAFELTVREQRFSDLGQFVTPDVISIGPGSEDWIAYRKLREQHGNKFRYDSIKMRPKETVILSDTMAYDFGVSSVWYTDENGEVHEMEDTFMVLLKKNKDGEWKMFRELASSLVP